MNNFFDKICCNRHELKEYLLHILGVYISGNLDDKTFMIFYGESSNNGKLKLVNLISFLLGNYYTAGPNGIVIKTKQESSNSHTAHMNMLIGKRLATINELDEDDFLSNDNIKTLTGDDKTPLRKLGEEFDLYTLLSHIILITNER